MKLRHTLIAIVAGLIAAAAADAGDLLPSWNDTATKKAIVAFVEKVTAEGSPDFVPPDEATQCGWTVVDVQNDWKQVFAPAPRRSKPTAEALP